MKRSVVAVLMVAGLSACFDDPTSSLRSGPAAVVLDRAAVVMFTSGDSLRIEARITDAQGNPLPISSPTWSSDDPTVAVVNPAETQAGSLVTAAYIVAATATGGGTTVRFGSRGVTDSIRVIVLPQTPLPASATTVAGDTVVVNPGSLFDAAATTIQLGGQTPYVLSRSATSIRVLSRGPYTGTVTLLNLIFTGGLNNTSLPLASTETSNSITVAAATLPAADAVVNASAVFGAGTLLKVTPPAGTRFDAGASTISLVGANSALVSRTADSLVAILARPFTGTVMVRGLIVTGSGAIIDSLRTTGNRTVNAAALPDANVTVRGGPLGANTEMKVTPAPGTTFSTTASNVVLGTANGTALVRTADSIVVISTNAYTGTVKVTAVNVTATGGVVDSLRTVGSSSINAAPFPGSFVQLGAGGLLDTVLVIGGANADFTTTGATASNVTINSGNAFVLRRAADTLYVLTNLSGTSAISVSNVVVGTATVATMSTAGTVTVGTTGTEPDEPANNSPGVVINVAAATPASPIIRYGLVDGDGGGLGTDADDLFTFTLATARTVTIRLDMGGSGAGGAVNPDIDLLVCNAACTAFPFGFGGATAGNPENHVITNMPAGTYNIYVNGWDTATKTVGYKLTVF